MARRRPELDVAAVIPRFADLPARVAEFVDAGATKFVVMPLADAGDWDAELGRLADALLPL